MSDLCLIRPANNAAAVELANWGSSLARDIASSSHSLRKDIYSVAATRAAVEKELGPSRATLFFGHGRKSRLEGYSSDVIDSSNVGKAAGNILIAIACWSAAKLGPDAFSAGVEAYLGFDEQFVWLSGDPEHQFEPAALSGIREMLNSGADIAVCATTTQTEFDSVFAFYKTGAGSARPNAIVGWLAAAWDRDHLVVLGKGSAGF